VLGFRPAATRPTPAAPRLAGWFQSRAGFSSRCDRTLRSTHHKRCPFQSRAGFSSRCDLVASLGNLGIKLVSIPCWVFVPLRRVRLRLQTDDGGCFNPVLGFRPAATNTRCYSLTLYYSFNPVLGFRPAATTDRSGISLGLGFNPVLGFRPAATKSEKPLTASETSFNPVLGFRPAATLSLVVLRESRNAFQSRAGFSSRCDMAPPSPPSASISFNPVLGFRPAATDQCDRLGATLGEFQSRAGFSSRCDRCGEQSPRTHQGVSIPCWVFVPLRPLESLLLVSLSAGFNPVLGFRPAATRLPLSGSALLNTFQSRAGFSSRCDSNSHLCQFAATLVSIPCWVFVPLRRPLGQDNPESRAVSIPCWVFVPLRLTARLVNAFPPECFNPVLGFRPAATGGKNTAIEVIKVSAWISSPGQFVDRGCTVI